MRTEYKRTNIISIILIMFRNKDKQSKIPLDKKLTKETTKYDKQYKNLDYDTIKDIVETNNKYLINTIKIQLQIILLQRFHIRKILKVKYKI